MSSIFDPAALLDVALAKLDPTLQDPRGQLRSRRVLSQLIAPHWCGYHETRGMNFALFPRVRSPEFRQIIAACFGCKECPTGKRAGSQQYRFPILRTRAVASQIRQYLAESNGSLGRDIGEKGGTKFQKTVFFANHEANDCDFRLFSTEWDKLHLCGKVQVDDGDIA